jgi:hypothetical protein
MKLTMYLRLVGVGVAQSVQWLGYGLDDRNSIPDRVDDGIFSLCHRVQTGSEAHPASYPMGLPGKAADAWS